jgi:cyclopropane-fatty-acyl-phospholipid synthase
LKHATGSTFDANTAQPAMSEISKPAIPAAGSSARFMSARFLRQRLLDRLARLRYGRLVIDDELGTVELGSPMSRPPELTAHVRVSDMKFYSMLAANGSVGAGEAYCAGLWQCDDLVALMRLLVRNRDLLDSMESGLARLGGMTMRLWHALQPNTLRGSRRNIAAHYDLGNDFFALFLSPDLMYSSAWWSGAEDTLEQASTRKLDVICAKLALRPDHHILEIGSGWGGFAMHAARHYGCHVTTTTISAEQHAEAARRIAAAGLDHRVKLLRQDYRELAGRFDRLVSIEMIEAIGAPNLKTYFAKLQSLLKADGLALIQAITIEDHRYAQALKSVDFIKRYVFPGSFIPSINAMLTAKTLSSDLALVHLEDFGHSYARTLQAWRRRFLARRAAARAQGFDERFIRLWEYYLAYCESGFLERSIGVAHLLLARPGARPVAPEWIGQEVSRLT